MPRKLKIVFVATGIVVALLLAFELGRPLLRTNSGADRTDTGTRATETGRTRAGARRKRAGSTGEPGIASTEPEFSLGLEPFEPLEVDPSHPALQFVDPKDGEGVRAMVLAGAPGIWPPETLTTDERGVLYLPKTDVDTLTGARIPRFELLARSPAGSLAFWDVVAFDADTSGAGEQKPTSLELEPASSVEVTVVGPRGARYSGANVRLSRGELGFVTLSKQTDPEGVASFSTIPADTYVASAQLAERGRGSVRFSHASESVSHVEIELTEEPVTAPSEPADSPESSEESSGPRDVTVRIRGLTDSAWRAANLRWKTPDNPWRLGTLAPGERSDERIWRKRIASPAVDLELEARGQGSQRKSFELEGDANDFTWEVDLRSRVEVFVVDPYGVPVEGAQIQVWDGDRKVVSKRSRGNASVSIQVGAESPTQVIAIDPRRGEGHRILEPGTTGEVTLQLDEPLFSVDQPPDRVRDRSRISEILQVPILVDGDSWRVDGTDPEARGIRAGLERGDRLLSVRELSDGWTVTYQRRESIGEIKIGDR